MGKPPKSIYRAISLFIAKAIFVYALLFLAWSYAIPTYLIVVTSLANKELQVIGIVKVTRLGPTSGQDDAVGVYHRAAAEMQEVLFDFRIETVHSSLPMLLSLILPVSMTIRRKLKVALIGALLLCFIDSLGCILVMTWSYTFLPDHHHYTPFSNSAFRDSVVNFLYYFYSSIGDSVLVLVIWVSFCWKSAEIGKYFREVIPGPHRG